MGNERTAWGGRVHCITGSGSGVEVWVYFDGGPDGELEDEESVEEIEPVRERLSMVIVADTSCDVLGFS